LAAVYVSATAEKTVDALHSEWGVCVVEMRRNSATDVVTSSSSSSITNALHVTLLPSPAAQPSLSTDNNIYSE